MKKLVACLLFTFFSVSAMGENEVDLRPPDHAPDLSVDCEHLSCVFSYYETPVMALKAEPKGTEDGVIIVGCTGKCEVIYNNETNEWIIKDILEPNHPGISFGCANSFTDHCNITTYPNNPYRIDVEMVRANNFHGSDFITNVFGGVIANWVSRYLF